MVPILDGNSEKCVQVTSNFCYLIFLMALLDREQSQIGFFLLIDLFFYARATCSELPSNISTMVTNECTAMANKERVSLISARPLSMSLTKYLQKEFN